MSSATTSVMTFTATGAPPIPTATRCPNNATGFSLGLPPTTKAACALALDFSGDNGAANATAAMRSCCNGSPLVLYEGGCSVFCNVRLQSLDDLQSCLTDKLPSLGSSCTSDVVSTNSSSSSSSDSSSTPTTHKGAGSALAAEGISKGAWLTFGVLAASFMLGGLV